MFVPNIYLQSRTDFSTVCMLSSSDCVPSESDEPGTVCLWNGQRMISSKLQMNILDTYRVRKTSLVYLCIILYYIFIDDCVGASNTGGLSPGSCPIAGCQWPSLGMNLRSLVHAKAVKQVAQSYKQSKRLNNNQKSSQSQSWDHKGFV